MFILSLHNVRKSCNSFDNRTSWWEKTCQRYFNVEKTPRFTHTLPWSGSKLKQGKTEMKSSPMGELSIILPWLSAPFVRILIFHLTLSPCDLSGWHLADRVLQPKVNVCECVRFCARGRRGDIKCVLVVFLWSVQLYNPDFPGPITHVHLLSITPVKL